MLVQSMREPDPVIFLEPKSRYWAKETGELETDGLPLHRARTVREGDACVILSYGAMVARSVKAVPPLVIWTVAVPLSCRFMKSAADPPPAFGALMPK